MLGNRVVAVGAAHDGVIDALLLHFVVERGLKAVVREKVFTAQHLKSVKGGFLVEVAGVVLGQLHHVREPIGVRENAQSACRLHLLVNPLQHGKAQPLGSFVKIGDLLGTRLDHGGKLLVRHGVGGFAVQRAPRKIVARLFCIGTGRDQRIDAVGAAKVDVVHVVVGQVYLLALHDAKVG